MKQISKLILNGEEYQFAEGTPTPEEEEEEEEPGE